MVEHVRHHKVPSKVKVEEAPTTGMGVHTEEILDGMEKIQAVAALVESVIVWRAQYIAWNIDIYKAEPLLFRLIYKEGSQNSQAMDLLARIYFQQCKYEKAKDLWNKAAELQPGNPALRRTAYKMQSIAKSPTAAMLRHKIGLVARGTLLLLLLCLFGYGGVLGVEKMQKWAMGSAAEQNLMERYDPTTKDWVYVPTLTTIQVATSDIVPVLTEPDVGPYDKTYNIGFTRKKVASGKEMGRIEVVVERSGSTLKASGRIPNLYTRYLVEQALWDVGGITDLDLRGLQVDRSYRVNKGDSLWIIAKRVYGDGSAWTLLAKENDLNDPNKLRIGQELALPLGSEILVQDS